MTLSAEVHASEESSDEDEFEQAVAATRQSERLNQVHRHNGADREAAATSFNCDCYCSYYDNDKGDNYWHSNDHYGNYTIAYNNKS